MCASQSTGHIDKNKARGYNHFLVPRQIAMASTSSSSRVTPSQAIEWLADQRRRPDRQSAKVVEYGTLVLEGGHVKALKDDVWAFLEQVGIAALDLGKFDLAQLCIARLNTRFPDSARVTAMQGMFLEARGEASKALKLYESVLALEKTNLTIVKRRIAVLKTLDRQRAAEALVAYLDTYYADPEGWQELAALYTEMQMHHQAAFALEELLILVPHNSFFVLQYAETLYTLTRLHDSYKAYLRVLEMCGVDVSASAGNDGLKSGPWVRALWGLKLVSKKLQESPTAASTAVTVGAAGTEVRAEQVEAIDRLVTDLLLNTAYKGSSEGAKSTREAARKVM